MTLTTAGLTNGGNTSHYRFQYDDSLAVSASNPAGSEPARTNAVIAACEGDFALMSGWFGGIGLSNISVHVTPQVGGADWNGSSSSSTVEIKAEGQPFSSSPDFIRYLLVSELTEIMMLTQNVGWFQGHDEGSKGEGLSRFLGAQFLDIHGLLDAGIRADFAVADGWLNSVRGDFVNNAPDDNAPDAVNGCTTLFIYWLHSQLGYGINAIVAAGAATLAGVYRNLSGDATDPFPYFRKTLDDAFPSTSTSHVTGPNPDDPFPIATATFELANFGTAQGWRVDRHPRFLADTTGDGRADIVGFGDAGVYRSVTRRNGSFEPVQLVIANFGYVAGGWRVDRHPRFLADTTGDGRADIVGFGDAGVYRSVAQPDGSFGPVELVVANFAYNAGGWRVESHPRLLADTTGDGRADIVGFGDAGVYRSVAQPDGSFGPVTLVVANFGTQQGWRVDRHPRFLADTTGDGRADIVGFGDAGPYTTLAQADGTFGAFQWLIPNFGYARLAGGWRVESHPRLLADTTGDRRADIVGFGDAGVYTGYRPLSIIILHDPAALTAAS
jgi:FG-GAP-like repeat